MSGRDRFDGKPKRRQGALPESQISKLWPRGAGGLYIQSRSFDFGPKGNGYLYRGIMRRIGAGPESPICPGKGISVRFS